MIGRTVSHYRILEELGGGGMGVVYRAEDTRLGRQVALKFLPPELSGDNSAKSRFLTEARAASALQHHNICTIHEIDETNDGQLFIVMDCYDGVTVRERLAAGEVAVAEAVDVVLQAAQGLSHAHAAGVIHRDIKPENLMVTGSGVVKMLDFGLARVEGITRMTKTGVTLGTVSYMSPEQAQGSRVDVRSDVWSLGVVLYELVAGQAPFTGQHETAVLYGVMHNDPSPLSSLREGVSPELERVVARALEKDPEKRYGSVEEFASDLSGLGLQHGRSSGSRSGGGARRWLTPIIAALAILAAIISWRVIPHGSGTAEAAEHALAVVDFLDLATPEDPTISAGMTELVTIGMVESCPIRVVSPEYLHDLRRRHFGEARGAIAEDQALEIARQSGATVLLAGRIGTMGGERFVTWRLVDTRTGESLGASRVDGEGFARIADEIIGTALPMIAEACGLRPQGDVVAVEGITTRSPAAYQHYVASLLAREQVRPDVRVRELEAAVAIDSTFALARFELARAYYSSTGYQREKEAQAHAKRAWELRDRLSLKDRMRLEAYRANLDSQVTDARDIYREMLLRWPDDREVLADLRALLSFRWYFHEALEMTEEALQMFPGEVSLRSEYANLKRATGDIEAYLRIMRPIPSRTNDASDWTTLGDAYALNGMIDSAEVAFNKALELDPSYWQARQYLAGCPAQRGDIEGSIRMLGRLLDSGALDETSREAVIRHGGFSPGLALYYCEIGKFKRVRELCVGHQSRCSQLLFRTGNEREVLDAARAMRASESDWRRFNSVGERAEAFVRLDSLDAAKEMVERLYGWEYRRGGVALYRGDLVSAWIALAEEDPDRALEVLAGMKARGTSSGGLLDIGYRETLARAYQMAGRYDEAVATLQALLRVTNWHSLAYLQLAQVYDEMGRAAEAEEAVAVFLDRWKHADEGLSQLEDARALLARLQASRL